MQGMKTKAKHDATKLPYLYEYYNFEGFFMNPLSAVKPAIARIYNSLIKALNSHSHLPRYVIILLDKDVPASVQSYHFDSGAKEMIEDNARWLLKQIAKALLARHDELKAKRSGAVPSDLTRVVWVKMLARPHSDNATLIPIWKLRGKFNGCLAEVLEVEDYMHPITLQKVNEFCHFDAFGNLTSAGQMQFWRELNDQIKNLGAMISSQAVLVHKIHHPQTTNRNNQHLSASR